jgi:hypothetical protein
MEAQPVVVKAHPGAGGDNHVVMKAHPGADEAPP